MRVLGSGLHLVEIHDVDEAHFEIRQPLAQNREERIVHLGERQFLDRDQVAAVPGHGSETWSRGKTPAVEA